MPSYVLLNSLIVMVMSVSLAADHIKAATPARMSSYFAASAVYYMPVHTLG